MIKIYIFSPLFSLSFLLSSRISLWAMARRSDQSGGGFPTGERDGEEGMKDAFCKREREDVERGSVRASESEGGEVASPALLQQRNYFTSRERE